MSKDETYNGWTNYESWLVALWLDNDQGSHEAAQEIAQSCDSDMAGGEALKTWLEDEFVAAEHDGRSGLVTDLINAALSRVDWREVGSHFREE